MFLPQINRISTNKKLEQPVNFTPQHDEAITTEEETDTRNM